MGIQDSSFQRGFFKNRSLQDLSFNDSPQIPFSLLSVNRHTFLRNIMDQSLIALSTVQNQQIAFSSFSNHPSLASPAYAVAKLAVRRMDGFNPLPRELLIIFMACIYFRLHFYYMKYCQRLLLIFYQYLLSSSFHKNPIILKI